jgi:hypothetical protein
MGIPSTTSKLQNKMKQKLIDMLIKYATKVEEAQTTNSIYFTMLNGIKVRISDHHSTHPDCDLAIDTPENMVAYTIFPVKVPAKFTYQTISVEDIYNYISYFAMIAPCFKTAQGSKKKKQKEATSRPKITEKVMTKVQALPEDEKKEIILNFILTYDLPDMSTKVQNLMDCKNVSKMEKSINKWTKQ